MKKGHYSKWCWLKLNIHIWKNEAKTLLHQLANEIEMDLRLKNWNRKIPRRKHKEQPPWCSPCSDILGYDTKSTGNKSRQQKK